MIRTLYDVALNRDVQGAAASVLCLADILFLV